jgi:enolase-phosphatase E1
VLRRRFHQLVGRNPLLLAPGQSAGTLQPAVIDAIVTDVEGTTTSLQFVQDVLLPYARARLAAFVQANGNRTEVLEQLIAAGGLCGRPLDRAAIVRELEAWSDAGRRAAPLQALQGMIWAAGYRRGEIVGHVYDDAAAALRRWHAGGLRLYVFSSGALAVPQLLFRHSAHGDLTPCCDGFFDAGIGSMQEPASYRAIAAAIGVVPSRILFLADSPVELAAGLAAGMRCRRVDRSTSPVPGAVLSFAAIDLRAVAT